MNSMKNNYELRTMNDELSMHCWMNCWKADKIRSYGLVLSLGTVIVVSNLWQMQVDGAADFSGDFAANAISCMVLTGIYFYKIDGG
jgi:hypothetical protein